MATLNLVESYVDEMNVEYNLYVDSAGHYSLGVFDRDAHKAVGVTHGSEKQIRERFAAVKVGTLLAGTYMTV